MNFGHTQHRLLLQTYTGMIFFLHNTRTHNVWNIIVKTLSKHLGVKCTKSYSKKLWYVWKTVIHLNILYTVARLFGLFWKIYMYLNCNCSFPINYFECIMKVVKMSKPSKLKHTSNAIQTIFLPRKPVLFPECMSSLSSIQLHFYCYKSKIWYLANVTLSKI